MKMVMMCTNLTILTCNGHILEIIGTKQESIYTKKMFNSFEQISYKNTKYTQIKINKYQIISFK